MPGPSPSGAPTLHRDGGRRTYARDFARVAALDRGVLRASRGLSRAAAVAPGRVLRALPARRPKSGEPFEAIFADFERIIVPGITHWNHPRFFAYFATSAAPAAIAAEALAATLDVKAMLWRTSPAATELEEVTMRWLGALLGCRRQWTGIIYDTASIAGFTALAAAREALDLRDSRARHDRARSAAAARLHHRTRRTRTSRRRRSRSASGSATSCASPATTRFACGPTRSRAAIDADLAAGMRPMAVVATVGTTSTTSIDPVARDRRGHAPSTTFGCTSTRPTRARRRSCRSFAAMLDGVELADSLVVNPHKWMFVPMDLSVLFVQRRGDRAPRVQLGPRVSHDARGRRRRTTWTTACSWAGAFARSSSGSCCAISARRAFASDCAGTSSWRRSSPRGSTTNRIGRSGAASALGRVLPLRAAGSTTPRLDALNAEAARRRQRDRRMFLSHTKIDGRYALRLAIGNLRTQRSRRRTRMAIAEIHVAVMPERAKRVEGRRGLNSRRASTRYARSARLLARPSTSALRASAQDDKDAPHDYLRILLLRRSARMTWFDKLTMTRV